MEKIGWSRGQSHDTGCHVVGRASTEAAQHPEKDRRKGQP